ncbi:glycine cleavage system protein GcvH [Bartonella quintana]|uniref:Glycine cleavage system H protein n=3 Tax=Bartonella quintana TaxID=803 RepID=GCSH_BARQU|nr:glycine cleavage system protein GcvH [Bartonella quintana]Q6FYZ6.1 RecName: Full=Glycine cleavage system H protein [Bartonella quintana str. Toulouse]AFR26655.1 glycine cleavage system protein H [Bartonella quintana RM-11]ETS11931.1 glycine cleavage system H protein [Bartonella quintana BQ2-D70]ETS13008.1 glycine cleavage system H protein [Bartonella quintana JK 73rel]ETS15081.1 glycine cleavage system H protein [Bartonella quintana JK 73]ETS16551.1 glycine cleavage system H protein [Barto
MSQIYFTQDHEWLSVEGQVVTVGITNYAQEQLGDLVFVDLPQSGTKLSKGDAAAVVESVKAASDVYAPLDGEVVEINEALANSPELVNQKAEKEGWLWKMTVQDETQLEGLLDEAAYKTLIG